MALLIMLRGWNNPNSTCKLSHVPACYTKINFCNSPGGSSFFHDPSLEPDACYWYSRDIAHIAAADADSMVQEEAYTVLPTGYC